MKKTKKDSPQKKQIVHQEKELDILDLERREEANKLPNRKKTNTNRNKINDNKYFLHIIYLFTVLFAGLLLYFVYFNTFKSSEIINSPYNTRQDTFADRVIRGDIISLDGEVLATTNISSDGTQIRSYPYENMFSHVIGYDTKGKSGIESLSNFYLLTSHAFIGERIVKELKEEKNQGDNVIVTLDTKLQKTAYDALGNYKGAVVAIEPSSGKILAMVSKPDFNPNSIQSNWDDLINSNESVLLNRATQGAYTPGSVFKIVTALSYMHDGHDPNAYNFLCEGSYTYNNCTINCYHGNQHGEEDFMKAFSKSCNSAYADIGLQINKETFQKTTNQLLFNQALPIDLPSNKSIFEMNDSTDSAKVMMTAMGQGDTMVSPIHMAMITSAIANGGILMKPYLLDHIENYTGTLVKKFKPEAYGRLLEVQEAVYLTECMKSVVSDGTAKALSGAPYTIAGKTGTAEYSTDKTKSHAWFTGFSNPDNPELVVTVIVEEAGSGSEFAVPIAQKMFAAYYNN